MSSAWTSVCSFPRVLPYPQSGIPREAPTETPFLTGRAVVALADDPSILSKTGKVGCRQDQVVPLRRHRWVTMDVSRRDLSLLGVVSSATFRREPKQVTQPVPCTTLDRKLMGLLIPVATATGDGKATPAPALRTRSWLASLFHIQLTQTLRWKLGQWGLRRPQSWSAFLPAGSTRWETRPQSTNHHPVPLPPPWESRTVLVDEAEADDVSPSRF